MEFTTFMFLFLLLTFIQTCSGMHSFSRKSFRQFRDRDSETVVSMPRIDLMKTSCVTKEVNVTITRKGCHPQTITNRFCYGVCHSFYIPKDREVTKVQDACVPTETIKQQVTLKCLKKKKSAKGRKRRRSGWRKKIVVVEKVLNCGCSRI